MENTPELPQLWRRFVASIIDIYFMILLYYLVSLVLPENTPDFAKKIILVLILFYDPVCTAFLGFTFGAFALSIRVRKAENPSQKISFMEAVVRFIVKVLLGWVSFITVHFNDQKQAMHDLVVGSQVIKKQK